MVEHLQKQRDEQQQRGDCAVDQLAATKGFEPSTPSVRKELKAATDEVERYLVEQFEDPEAGMISEEIVAMAANEDQKKVS